MMIVINDDQTECMVMIAMGISKMIMMTATLVGQTIFGHLMMIIIIIISGDSGEYDKFGIGMVNNLWA